MVTAYLKCVSDRVQYEPIDRSYSQCSMTTVLLTLTLNLLNRLAAIGAECMNTVNRRKQTNNTWSAIDTRNTLDCDQSNYSSRIVFPSYLLNLAKPKIAIFDPPTPKIPS